MNSHIEICEIVESRDGSSERHLFKNQRLPQILTHTFHSVKNIDDFESYKGSIIQKNKMHTISPNKKNR